MAHRSVAQEREAVNCLYELIFPNGKSYWGITQRTAEERFWKGHVRQALGGSHLQVCLAIRKYGAHNVQVLTRVYGCRAYVGTLEIAAIAHFKTTNRKYGYNISPGGDSFPITIWITDGVSNTRIMEEDELPDGWRFGRVLSEKHLAGLKRGQRRPEVREQKRDILLKRMSGRRWITDGITNHRILPNEAIPEGWRLGRVISQSHIDNMIAGVRGESSKAKQKAAWARNREHRLAKIRESMTQEVIENARKSAKRLSKTILMYGLRTALKIFSIQSEDYCLMGGILGILLDTDGLMMVARIAPYRLTKTFRTVGVWEEY